MTVQFAPKIIDRSGTSGPVDPLSGLLQRFSTPQPPFNFWPRGKVARRVLVFTLAILPIAVITVAGILLNEQIRQLGSFGYVGVFGINLLASGTILIPIPGLATAAIAGGVLDPFVVAIAGATGSTLGEGTAYFAGALARSETNEAMVGTKWYVRVQNWLQRRGSAAIFVTSAVPIPGFDLVGFAAGSMKYPIYKFAAACWLGRMVKFTAAALIGNWGMGSLAEVTN